MQASLLPSRSPLLFLMASPTQEEIQVASQPTSVTIPVDTDENDSAYAESTHESDTESLASSILKYRWEHGRRYHAYKDGQYWGPNDKKQLDAEDFVHQMFLLVLDSKLFLAPLEEPKKVLDVGTGTGIWALCAILHASNRNGKLMPS